MRQSENEWISKELQRFRVDPAPGEIGIGDDAAVFGVSGRVVATTDAMVEDTHFREHWLTDFELGFRAIAINYSDLAAMGAAPIGVLLSIETSSLPHRFGREFWDGVEEILREFGGRVLGGNVTRRNGPISVAVTAIGSVVAGSELRRDTAQAGETLYVTGPVGRAAGVREALESNLVLSGSARAPWCLPAPRTREMQPLREAGVPSAAIDLSDGLALDASRLCDASGVGVDFDRAALLAFGEGDDDRTLELSLFGGEDYEVLFTGPAALPDEFRSLAIPIGRTTKNIDIQLDGESIADSVRGWDPFGDRA